MSTLNVLRKPRLIGLSLALVALLFVWIRPQTLHSKPIYRFTVIVDITRSMNASDYQLNGQVISRLNYIKHTLRELLHRLPCQSQVGLGLFTERRATLLFEPLEICHSFAEIDAALAHLDWRMAWAADSNIGKGLLNILTLMQNRSDGVIFITDGQEAPPINPLYRADLSELKGKVKGLILGAGGLAPVPIPKFNAAGQLIGVYTENDVPHRSTFGQSNLDPAQIEGYDARNAPFGNSSIKGNEHLTRLHETYLQQLALESGLHYARLDNIESLLTTLAAAPLSAPHLVATDVRWQSALIAFAVLVWLYWPQHLGRKLCFNKCAALFKNYL